jgi:hypothetical protein
MNRNLDGVYFRAKRDGNWQNICFTDLTSDEREEIMRDRPVEWLKQMIRILADTINRIGEVLDVRGDME